jgi:type II secretory pathway predicted ATPase ExeA/phage tail protein X
MYAHFYHLSESPFNLTPDPKFQYVNESTREAMASLLHGIRSRKGFITLIAEAGTGKTTMLKRVVDEIEGEAKVVFVFNPGVSFDELLEFICMELGIRTDSAKRLHLLDRLNTYLLEQLTVGVNVVVMIDEAQTLEDSVLEELRLLSNLETAKEKILQMVLSGQPELEDKLRKPQLRQLRQRIGVRCTLRAMQAGEIGAYVETRLRSAGADRADFFTPVGLRKVWKASKGIPRVINAICDNAMMIAFAEGKQRIDSSVVSEAVRDLHGDDISRDFREGVRDWVAHPAARYVAAAVLALAFLIPSAANLIDAWRNIDSEQVASLPVADSDGTRRAVAGLPSVDAGASDFAASAGVVPAAAEPKRSPVLATAGEPRRIPEPSGLTEPAAKRDVPMNSSAASVRADRAAADTAPGFLEGGRNSAVMQSVRRAELLARTTAARIYHGKRSTLEEAAIAALDSPELSSSPPRAEPEVGESLVEVINRRREFTRSEGSDMVGSVEDDLAEIVEDLRLEANNTSIATTGAKEAAVVAAAKSDDARKDASADVTADAGIATDTENARELSQAVERLARAASNLAVAVEDGTEKEAKIASAATTAKKSEPTVSPAERYWAAESKLETLGPRQGALFVGRHVRVQPGDTIWDIAIGYYGTAGESALTRILNSNPGIRDPRRLMAGAHVYVPFRRADRMVQTDVNDTYRVLLTVSPKRSVLEETKAWLADNAAQVRLGTATVEAGETLYQLYAVGFRNRREAVALAERLLASRASADESRQTA